MVAPQENGPLVVENPIERKTGSRRGQTLIMYTNLSDPPTQELPVFRNFTRWLRYVHHPVCLQSDAGTLKVETSFG